MTKEEELQFLEIIKETIIPYAQNMSDEQIKNLIETVQKQNPNLPFGFGNMLLEQIRLLKQSQ
ncbi:hypothetical protein [Malaciobacter mytili]|uniref:Uncharacterized protein n=1 Tax=Malaciobacter mytili LMG 24559 TaxID=1032238 RepID=A0AAX2AG74_9BACT|nr:hypothetical protein [Malaciobacter mytili]AXH15086.1 hypothetical protein AMYT_1510 [Malaciobacter mytili LMG 24559]RXI42937.1 hypothetical protein CRU99_08660 [Malaciobacter mytili]RXK15595.1 hypothetical protein CP985_07500 [Malaciobacter mytili LMG 24559]